MKFSAQQCALLLDTARSVIRAALAGRETPPPTEMSDPALMQPAGCFASLHNFRGKLRGCVGKLEATEPLLATVRAVACSVLKDPRFGNDPVTAKELAFLELELSILSPMKPVEHMLAFDPLADGIFLTIGKRSGCFLPQVARETGWSREQLLDRLSNEKLGLSPDAWRTPAAKLSVFSTVLCGPEPFENAHAAQSAAPHI